MVPAAGIAATADEAIADDGDFELLADLAPADNFSKGTINTLTADPNTVTLSKVTNKDNEFTATLPDSGNGFSVKSLDLYLADNPQQTSSDVVPDSNYTISVTNEAGNKVTTILEAGVYTVSAVANDDSSWAGGVAKAKLTVSETDISTLTGTITAYNKAALEGNDWVNAKAYGTNTFVYTAEAQQIGFFVDTTGTDYALTEGVDYTVKYSKNGSEVALADVIGAGSYYAVLTGIGKYSGTKTVAFTIGELDIRNSNTSVKVIAGNDRFLYGNETLPAHPSKITIGDIDYTSDALLSQVGLKWYQDGDNANPVNAATALELGQFNAAYEISSTNANINKTNSVSFPTDFTSVVRVENKASILYKGEAVPESITINADKHEAWSNSSITAFNGSTQLSVANWATSSDPTPGAAGYTLAWVDSNGNVTNSMPAAYGKYKLIVRALDPTSHAYAGYAEMTVNYVGGVIDCNTNMTVYYDGNNVKDVEATYDSVHSVASKIRTKLWLGNTVLDPLATSPDYTVKYLDADGNEVASLKDAGSYTMVVESEKYELQNNTVSVVIKPVDLNLLQLDSNQLSNINGQEGFLYTGNSIPVSSAVQYKLASMAGNLPAQAWGSGVTGYDLVVTNEAGEEVDITKIKDAGTYTVKAVPADADSPNYTVSAPAVTFRVLEQLRFIDVPTSFWAHDVINQAADNKYMGGYNGTKLFGPNDQITRAQVACVFYNMAGGAIAPDAGKYDESEGWVSFADVDGHMYYSKALAWAKEAGVVNGFAGTDNFGPDQSVTREQFACMLANYAKKVGNFKAADTEKVLSGMPDGASVDGWARENVAWAVSSKIMGNGGAIDPLSTITRAEAAAMAVNYQPHSLSGQLLSTAISSMSVAAKGAELGDVTKALGITTNEAVVIPASSDGKAKLTVVMSTPNQTIANPGISGGSAGFTRASDNASTNGVRTYVYELTSLAAGTTYTFTYDVEAQDVSSMGYPYISATATYTVQVEVKSDVTKPNGTMTYGNVGDPSPASVSIDGNCSITAQPSASSISGGTKLYFDLASILDSIGAKITKVETNFPDKFTVSSENNKITLANTGTAAAQNDAVVITYTVTSSYGNTGTYTISFTLDN